LNVSRHNDVHLYSSDRIAHIVGNGLAVLIERATGYGELFGEDDFAFYGSIEELAEQLGRLVADDAHRRRLAENGWRRYAELFAHTIVTGYMTDVLFGEHDASHYEWPTLTSSPASGPVARAA
jgi:spore maturation protein CgeB